MGDYDYSPFEMPTEESLASGVMKALPGVVTTTAWNVGRVTNTVLKGGTQNRWYRRALHRGETYHGVEGGMFRQGIPQTLFHPFRFSRPAEISGSGKVYTPFNVLADIGNRAFRNDSALLRKVPFFGNDAAEYVKGHMGTTPGGKETELFSSGVIGRISAAERINKINIKRVSSGSAWMDRSTRADRRFMKKLETIQGSIKDMNPGYGAFFESAPLREVPTAAEALRFHGAGVIGTIDSQFSGQLAGRMRGYSARYAQEVMGKTGTVALERSALQEGSWAWKGFNAAQEGEMGALGKFVGSGALGGVLRGVSIAGYVMMAHDLAKAAGKVVGAGLNTAMEAGNSAIGSINKPVMGMGFKDNSVAQTARSRGVMAIQNSRLNARSILGSEAGAMFAHFG